MENCLVKKFKVVVNNTNLPVLEVMSHITLDALTRGGDMQVSDAQKTALNHFFYEIGAVSNNTLWGKVRTLMLPVIGNGQQYVVQNYKIAGSYCSTTNVQSKAGALAITIGNGAQTLDFNSATPKITINPKDFAVVAACTGESSFLGSTFFAGFRGNNASNKVVQRVFNNPGGTVVGLEISDNTSGSNVTASKRFETEVYPVIGLMNVTSSGITAKGIIADGTEVNVTTTDYGNFAGLSSSLEESSYALRIGTSSGNTNSFDLGILIDFSEALTDAEVTTVLTAVKALRTAFLPSA